MLLIVKFNIYGLKEMSMFKKILYGVVFTALIGLTGGCQGQSKEDMMMIEQMDKPVMKKMKGKRLKRSHKRSRDAKSYVVKEDSSRHNGWWIALGVIGGAILLTGLGVGIWFYVALTTPGAFGH